MFSTEPTEYDLRFTLFGIPVRVSIWFWLLAAFLGFNLVQDSIGLFIVWMLVVFISILVHEFGHALLAKAFGYPVKVLLYHFGGLAMFEPDSRYTRSKSISMSLAGPGAGLSLFVISLIASFFLTPLQAALSPSAYELLDKAFWFSIVVNLTWSLLNLLPILPLDGGNVFREICTYFSPRNGVRFAAQTGAVLAGALCAYCVTQGMIYNAVLVGSLCAHNIQIAQQRSW